jgi:hypothetical protein
MCRRLRLLDGLSDIVAHDEDDGSGDLLRRQLSLRSGRVREWPSMRGRVCTRVFPRPVHGQWKQPPRAVPPSSRCGPRDDAQQVCCSVLSGRLQARGAGRHGGRWRVLVWAQPGALHHSKGQQLQHQLHRIPSCDVWWCRRAQRDDDHPLPRIWRGTVAISQSPRGSAPSAAELRSCGLHVVPEGRSLLQRQSAGLI